VACRRTKAACLARRSTFLKFRFSARRRAQAGGLAEALCDFLGMSHRYETYPIRRYDFSSSALIYSRRSCRNFMVLRPNTDFLVPASNACRSFHFSRSSFQAPPCCSFTTGFHGSSVCLVNFESVRWRRSSVGFSFALLAAPRGNSIRLPAFREPESRQPNPGFHHPRLPTRCEDFAPDEAADPDAPPPSANRSH
jgi:hypothetical protein